MAKKSNNNNGPKKPKKTFSRGEVASIFNVDPKTAGRWVRGGSKTGEPLLDSVETPAGTRRATEDSLISSGVCRNCWTLKSLGGECAC